MIAMPPKLIFKGDKQKAILLKSKALQFYNFVVGQAEQGGTPRLDRTVTFPDGSSFSVSTFKEGNYGIRKGSIIIYPSPSNLPVNTDDIYISSLNPNDISYRSIYSKNPPVNKLSFYTGDKYWYSRKKENVSRTAISWSGGYIFIGGKYSRYSSSFNPVVSACYNPDSKKVIIVTNDKTLSVNKITDITEDFFSTIPLSSRTLVTPYAGLINATIYGFKSDTKTLYIKWATPSGSQQKLVEYKFSNDYTNEIITEIWSGGNITETWGLTNVFKEYYPVVPSSLAIKTESTDNYTMSQGTNKEAIHSVFINGDSVSVVLYTINTNTASKDSYYESQGKGYVPGYPIYYPYVKNISTTLHNKSFKYVIKNIINSELIEYPLSDLSGTTSLNISRDYLQYTGGGIPTGTNPNLYLNHDTHSFSYIGNFKIPLYINTIKNIVIYEERVYNITFKYSVLTTTVTELSESFTSNIKLDRSGNTDIISTSTSTGLVDAFLLKQDQAVTMQTSNRISDVTETFPYAGLGSLNYIRTQIWTRDIVFNKIKDCMNLLNEGYYDQNPTHIFPGLSNLSYAFDDKNLLTVSTLTDAANLTSNDKKTTSLLYSNILTVSNGRVDDFNTSSPYNNEISVTQSNF